MTRDGEEDIIQIRRVNGDVINFDVSIVDLIQEATKRTHVTTRSQLEGQFVVILRSCFEEAEGGLEGPGSANCNCT